MKILFVHNKYQKIGGEDSVLENEMSLLKQHGHKVLLYSVSNDSIKNFYDKIKVFKNIHYSPKQKKLISNFIIKHKPDIVHVHNFFPQITPSVFDACVDNNVPVVSTLHNFRLICPSAILMHKNKLYEKSFKYGAYSTIIDKVYKNSFIGTYAVAKMIEYHKRKNTWNLKVDQFIALTNFAKSKFLDAGFLSDKISIKPNFCNLSDSTLNQKRDGVLFVGRLSEEKGLHVLLESWKKMKVKLKIIGDGPLLNSVKNCNNKYIKYLGFMKQEDIFLEMKKSSFLVFPSIWYEGFPMVILESFANGLPVVASNLGSMSEIIKNNYNGLHFSAGDSNDLLKKVDSLIHDKNKCNQLSKNAINDYNENYSAKNNYELLLKIYKKVINDKQSKNS